jgi:hypothetical protein
MTILYTIIYLVIFVNVSIRLYDLLNVLLKGYSAREVVKGEIIAVLAVSLVLTVLVTLAILYVENYII